MAAKKEIQDSFSVKGIDVRVISKGNDNDYISLTDLAKYKSEDPSDAIKNWMRNRNTIEFLGVWETLNNPDFKPVEFDGFKKEAGLNSFIMTPTKWIKSTNAVGIRTKRGRYGSGTFAHVDIALDFATWISPEFRLYVFQEYRRLKSDESSRINLDWNEKRLFATINYRIHTDAVKDTMPPQLGKNDQRLRYAQEGDILNLAVFGMTAKQWRDAHPGEGNLRDNASLAQNLVLSNLESMNAIMLRKGISQRERLLELNEIARQQMASLTNNPTVKRLGDGNESKQNEN
ncbi:MAG: KilA-N domain-containing protein [Bifidobacterium pseudocatenulatum]